MPQGRYSDVITRLKPNAASPGDIVHLDGRALGRHEGIIHYTVGQRPRSRPVGGRAALRRRARRGQSPCRRRPARGAGHPPHPPARRELARGRAAGRARREPGRDRRPRAFDARARARRCCAASPARPGRRSRSSSSRRRTASRRARPACSTRATIRAPACSAAAPSPGASARTFPPRAVRARWPDRRRGDERRNSDGRPVRSRRAAPGLRALGAVLRPGLPQAPLRRHIAGPRRPPPRAGADTG